MVYFWYILGKLGILGILGILHTQLTVVPKYSRPFYESEEGHNKLSFENNTLIHFWFEFYFHYWQVFFNCHAGFVGCWDMYLSDRHFIVLKNALFWKLKINLSNSWHIFIALKIFSLVPFLHITPSYQTFLGEGQTFGIFLYAVGPKQKYVLNSEKERPSLTK